MYRRVLDWMRSVQNAVPLSSRRNNESMAPVKDYRRNREVNPKHFRVNTFVHTCFNNRLSRRGTLEELFLKLCSDV